MPGQIVKATLEQLLARPAATPMRKTGSLVRGWAVAIQVRRCRSLPILSLDMFRNRYFGQAFKYDMDFFGAIIL